MQAFLILPHCSLLPTFATATIFLFIVSNITVVIHCCNHLSFCCAVHSWRYSTTRLEAGGTWTTITTSMLSYTTNAYHRISPLPTQHLHPRLSPHHYHLFHNSAHYFTVNYYYYYLLFIFALLIFSPDWTAIITICCTHIYHKPTLQPRDCTHDESPKGFPLAVSPCRCASQRCV